MQILVSDANILIDLEVGELLEAMFQLPYRFCTPDILYQTELSSQHSHLVDLGLQVKALTSDTMVYAYQINNSYKQPSLNDLFALALAKQERCPLLTGDMQLRKAAQKEAVVVKGTLWVIEQMVILEHLSKVTAKSAYVKMQESGRRLPFATAFERLQKLD